MKPTFESTIAALRTTHPEVPWIGPTDEEADAADALEIVHEHHFSDDEKEDPTGHWGTCRGCSDPWPCKTWMWGDQLAGQFLGRAAQRVYLHARGADAPAMTSPVVELLPSPSSGTDVIVEGERRRLARLREVPVTPVRCRYPNCRRVVSVPHPLVEGYIHAAACREHEGTTEDRYPYGWTS